MYLFFEHDVPKGKERQKEYRQWVADKLVPNAQKMNKKGMKSTGLADNTGHIIGIWEFNDMTAFSELWEDEEDRGADHHLERCHHHPGGVEGLRHGRLHGPCDGH